MEQSVTGDYLVYADDGELCAWSDGEIKEYDVGEDTTLFYPAKNNRVVTLAGGDIVLYYEDNIKTFGSDVAELVPVHAWSNAELTDYPIGCERTGAWFQRSQRSLVWHW